MIFMYFGLLYFETTSFNFSASNLNIGPGESFPFSAKSIYLFALENENLSFFRKFEVDTVYLAGPGDKFGIFSVLILFPIEKLGSFFIAVVKNPFKEYFAGDGVFAFSTKEEQELDWLDLKKVNPFLSSFLKIAGIFLYYMFEVRFLD